VFSYNLNKIKNIIFELPNIIIFFFNQFSIKLEITARDQKLKSNIIFPN